MLQLFDDFGGKSTIHTASSFKEYALLKYKNKYSYRHFLNYLKNKNVLRTTDKISFSKLGFTEYSRKTIIEVLGKPKFKFRSIDLNGELNIYFYILKLGGIETRMELHFLNNSLFYFNYAFPSLKPGEKNMLMHLVGQKYLHQTNIPSENYYISDENHSKIFFCNSENFTIHYLNFSKTPFLHNVKKIQTDHTPIGMDSSVQPEISYDSL